MIWYSLCSSSFIKVTLSTRIQDLKINYCKNSSNMAELIKLVKGLYEISYRKKYETFI